MRIFNVADLVEVRADAPVVRLGAADTLKLSPLEFYLSGGGFEI